MRLTNPARVAHKPSETSFTQMVKTSSKSLSAGTAYERNDDDDWLFMLLQDLTETNPLPANADLHFVPINMTRQIDNAKTDRCQSLSSRDECISMIDSPGVSSSCRPLKHVSLYDFDKRFNQVGIDTNYPISSDGTAFANIEYPQNISQNGLGNESRSKVSSPFWCEYDILGYETRPENQPCYSNNEFATMSAAGTSFKEAVEGCRKRSADFTDCSSCEMAVSMSNNVKMAELYDMITNPPCVQDLGADCSGWYFYKLNPKVSKSSMDIGTQLDQHISSSSTKFTETWECQQPEPGASLSPSAAIPWHATSTAEFPASPSTSTVSSDTVVSSKPYTTKQKLNSRNGHTESFPPGPNASLSTTMGPEPIFSGLACSPLQQTVGRTPARSQQRSASRIDQCRPKSTMTGCIDRSVRCRIQSCRADMSSESGYSKRRRLCKTCMRSPFVLVDSCRMRYCQQCSRLHPIEHFDGLQRSCRAKLCKHRIRFQRHKLETESTIASTGST